MFIKENTLLIVEANKEKDTSEKEDISHYVLNASKKIIRTRMRIRKNNFKVKKENCPLNMMYSFVQIWKDIL